MSLDFQPLHADFGALATGLDLRRPLTPEQVRAVDDGMNRYGVLLFRGQPLSPDEQMAFTQHFGPLDLGFRRVKNAPGSAQPHRFAYDELADISNVEASGAVAARESRKIVSNIANQMWHADSSFQRPRAKYSMLHAVVLPGSGGETEFADQRNGWDRLDDATRHASRRWWPSTSRCIRASCSATPTTRRPRSLPSLRRNGRWCRRTVARAGATCTWAHTRARSTAWWWPRRACCCGTCWSTRRTRTMSTATAGRWATS